MMAGAVADAARDALAAGLSVVPPAEDGTKRPLTEWKLYQSEHPSAGKLASWYGRDGRTGLGAVCGAISGNLECFEFDCPDTYRAFLDAATAAGLAELVER